MKKTFLTFVITITSVLAFATNPQSVTVIKFGDDNTLFIGDSKSATLYAYTVPNVDNSSAQKAYNIHDLSNKISTFLKVNPLDLIVRDMSVNPKSKEAYIAIDTKSKNGYTSQIVVVNQDGKIRKFDLVSTKHTEIKINDAPTKDIIFWDKTPMRSLTFTDIDFYKGKLYVSGMSNAEFSSALRVIDYPFNSKISTTSLEIYHAVHGQNETRAPIQTLQFVNLNNVDYVLAAYTCTPLVLIPVKDLKNGAHIVGKTIAEMGYGNTPVDIIKFQSEDFDKKKYEGIILANRNRTAQFVNLDDLSIGSKTDGIGYAGMAEHAGIPITNLPMTGLMQMEDQDDYHILTMRRNDETGSLELISFLKNLYLRLDEFVTEYDQPTYKYNDPNQIQMKGYQNMMIQDLGQDKFKKQ
ncbi:hypothetical protein NAT51_15685 [Flavobacterium amniphilum]|uniref:hypothetical protein n=1 Tax=Flavobacterium amniphilum TaxID=1834035 RepID=UPI002029C426|nr:hypothetical protein [Flavobacterium amniphilum]MCL9806978.1 hypothetical protein [Flavobacterium amniphilum]